MREKCIVCAYFMKNKTLTEMDRVNRLEEKEVRILGNCFRKADSIFMVYGKNHCKYFRSAVLYPLMKPKAISKKERKSFFLEIWKSIKGVLKK